MDRQSSAAMQRRLLALLVAGLGALGGGAALAVREHAPALQPELRAGGPDGDWRAVPGRALYDAAAYDFEQGYAHLRRLMDAAGAPAAAPGAAAPPLDQADLAEAERLFERALRRNPGDAMPWTGLAMLAALRGEAAAVLPPLRRSWALAPYSDGLAPLRLPAIAAAFALAEAGDRAAIARDLAVLRRKNLNRFNEMATLFPELAALAPDASE